MIYYIIYLKYDPIRAFRVPRYILIPYGFKASDIGQYEYKIHDDSIRLRHFLDVDNEDGIKKQVKNLLCYAFRDTCLEIFSKWDKKTIIIAESSDVKKIPLHILTFAIRFSNIAKVTVFTELIHKKLLTSLQKNNIIDNIANK